MGDGESMEGNVWEAINFAGFYKLDNLCAIIDINRLGQSDPAPLQHDMNTYRWVNIVSLFVHINIYRTVWSCRARLESFGFHAIVVDGHDVEELAKAFAEVLLYGILFLLKLIISLLFQAENVKDKPSCILAKTFKGHDYPKIENEMNWHGKALGDKSDEVVSHLRYWHHNLSLFFSH